VLGNDPACHNPLISPIDSDGIADNKAPRFLPDQPKWSCPLRLRRSPVGLLAVFEGSDCAASRVKISGSGGELRRSDRNLAAILVDARALESP